MCYLQIVQCLQKIFLNSEWYLFLSPSINTIISSSKNPESINISLTIRIIKIPAIPDRTFLVIPRDRVYHHRGSLCQFIDREGFQSEKNDREASNIMHPLSVHNRKLLVTLVKTGGYEWLLSGITEQTFHQQTPPLFPCRYRTHFRENK